MSGHRLVEVGRPSHLKHGARHLIVEQEGVEVGRVPVEDLGVLVLDSYGITMTQELVVACLAHNVAVVHCDEKHMPGGMLVPFEANTLHARILRQQAAASEPTKKRIWQAVVSHKVRAQADVLKRAAKPDAPLRALSSLVRSGDPENLEGRAAALYWESLFGDAFLRNRNEAGVNAMLNYGYAVLRATVARAVVASGMHPALGVHHRNQYNAFALADDIMEPFRPLVDWHVYEMTEGGEDAPTGLLGPGDRRALLQFLGFSVKLAGKSTPVPVAVAHYVATLKAVLVGEKRKLVEMTLD